MIYQMALDVADRLASRSYPVTLSYGPERLSRDGSATHSHSIVIERDREGGDTVSAPVANGRNPRRRLTRGVGVACTIRVRSPLPGARVHEHDEECDRIVDGLLVALSEWFVEARVGSGLEIIESRFLGPDDYHQGAEWAPGSGAAYRLRFAVPRAVDARDYVGAARPTGTITDVGRTDRVTVDGTNYEEI